MKTRVLSYVLALTMLVSLIGCSSSAPAASSKAAPAASAAPAAPAASAAPAESKAEAPKDNFPSGPITFVVPWKPGGANDIGSRILAATVEKDLGVPVVISNYEGGGGWIGWDALLAAKNDGYTVGACALPTMTSGYVNPENQRKNSYTDFDPIINWARDYVPLCIRPDEKRFTNLEEFIAYAKENEVTVSCGAKAGAQGVSVLLFNDTFGTKLVPMYGTGGSESMTNVMGGHADASFQSVGEVIPNVKGGQLKAIAVLAENRVKALPDVPTVIEVTGKKVVSDSARGILTPAGVPENRLKVLRDAFTKACQDPDTVKKMEEAGFEIQITDAAGYIELLKAEEEMMIKYAPLFGWEVKK